MSEQPVPAEGGSSTGVTSSKPPLPSAMPSAKSDSFRRVEYTPPSEAAAASKNEETFLTAWWRRITNSGRNFTVDEPAAETAAEAKNSGLTARLSSDEVVEELTKRGSHPTSRSQELPPLPQHSPSLGRTASGKVGLPSVKLIPVANAPTTEKKEEKTSEADRKTPETQDIVNKEETKESSIPALPATGGEETVKEPAVKEAETAVTTVVGADLVKEKATVDEVPAKKEETIATAVAASEPVLETKPATEEQTAVETTTVQQSTKEDDAPANPEPVVETTTQTVTTTETTAAEEVKPPVAASEQEKTTTEATGASIATTVQSEESTARNLKTSKTMGAGGSSRKFLRRMFTFGGAGETKHDPEQPATQTETATVAPAKIEEKTPPPTATTYKEEEPKATTAASTSSTSETTTNKPPEPKEQAVETVAVVAEEKTSPQKHDRTMSELTREELDELKASFITGIKQKGINIEGKYTKSSADFDSPLLFLLDLHTFAETQNTPLKMEHILLEKYGRDTKVLSEFNEAVGLRVETQPVKQETKPNGNRENEEEATVDTPNTDVYESGLDTAKTNTGCATLKVSDLVETSGTATTEPLTEERDTELVTEHALEAAVPAETKETGTETTTTTTTIDTETTTAAATTTPQMDEIEEERPPSIPYRDETTRMAVRNGCFFCSCLHPAAN